MIESIEGKRGLPRHKPPFVSKVGFLVNLPSITILKQYTGLEIFLKKVINGIVIKVKEDIKGHTVILYLVRVKNPGVKVAPAGITMNELLNDYCGGMQDGHKFFGYLPGGASGGILPADKADVPLDFGTLEELGCFIGSGAIVVFSDKDSIKSVVLNLLKFFNDESCGQCTPCRVGTEKAVKLLEKNIWDEKLLRELVDTMGEASICGLGQAAGNPITCSLNYFKDRL